MCVTVLFQWQACFLEFWGTIQSFMVGGKNIFKFQWVLALVDLLSTVTAESVGQ